LKEKIAPSCPKERHLGAGYTVASKSEEGSSAIGYLCGVSEITLIFLPIPSEEGIFMSALDIALNWEFQFVIVESKPT
jgi:hypothetical protein